MKRIWILTLSLLLALSGCSVSPAGTDPEAEERSGRYVSAMDTIMNLTAYGSHREEALNAAEAEIHRLDALLSTGQENSEISRLNRLEALELSDDTRVLVERALELYRETEGAFDITVYPIMQLWGFPTLEYHLPTEQELDTVLRYVGSDQLTYDAASGKLTLGPGQQVDLGGIGKGYTSARVMELYREAGVTSGMVSLGGNVQCLGRKPDGSLWRIGIQDPQGTEGTLSAVLEVADAAVITSGGYERYFTDPDTGKVYCHIVDPRTGWPVDNDLSSVTIVSTDGTLADGLSTSLYLMGLEGAKDFWRSHSEAFQTILIDREGKLYVSEGLREAVTSEKPTAFITAK